MPRLYFHPSSGASSLGTDDAVYDNHTILTCPIRGPLNVKALAKDGMTVTEEARRIDFLNFY